jgi:GDPmannose 4,6-dehydratase
MTRKTAFITGISGQDGAYLAAFLCERGYDVHGLVRWDSYMSPTDGMARLDALGLVRDDITLHMGDLTDANNLNLLIKEIQPSEIYNLAALSHVKVSFETPASTLQTNTMGTLNILEAVRVLGMEGSVRVYQASSSEMFGSIPAPQNERAQMEPCSPYGAAKLAAYHLAKIYRQSYGMFVSNGILFNHESPLRGEDFVTHKITRAVAEIEMGRRAPLSLGNLDSVRDWGAAQDYVRGMWMMLQHGEADDFVLATGKARSVRDFAAAAFAHIGVEIEWRGKGEAEQGVDAKTGRVMVDVDPQFFRPLELNFLLGDCSKARDVLGWMPEIGFDALVAQMVNADRAVLREKDDVSCMMAG